MTEEVVRDEGRDGQEDWSDEEDGVVGGAEAASLLDAVGLPASDVHHLRRRGEKRAKRSEREDNGLCYQDGTRELCEDGDR